MAKSTSGKWVSRVGSQGGGKTYRKTRPANYYGALVVIVVLGLALTAYSRYEYENPTKAHSTAIQPRIGSTRYAALSIQACGDTLPYLTADALTYKGGYTVGNDNVIRVSPQNASEAGDNATLKTFASEFAGLTLTSTKLVVPTKTGVANPKTTYTNGEVCATGTKYAGQKGKVVYAYWTSFSQKKPTLTTDPGSIKFTKNVQITVAFVPKGVTPTVPATQTIDAMVEDATATSTTTTTAPTTTTTAATSTTTTTAPTTTTTKG